MLSDFRTLRVQIEADLIWSANTAVIIKKAQQRFYLFGTPQEEPPGPETFMSIAR